MLLLWRYLVVGVVFQALTSVASVFLEAEDLPDSLRPAIVEHMVMVHQSVRQYSVQFAEELRRHNYVTVSAIVIQCFACCFARS